MYVYIIHKFFKKSRILDGQNIKNWESVIPFDTTSYKCLNVWLCNIIYGKKGYTYILCGDDSFDGITIEYTIIDEKYGELVVYQTDPAAWGKEFKPIKATLETKDLVYKFFIGFTDQIISVGQDLFKIYNSKELKDIKGILNSKIIRYLKNNWYKIDENISKVNHIFTGNSFRFS